MIRQRHVSQVAESVWRENQIRSVDPQTRQATLYQAMKRLVIRYPACPSCRGRDLAMFFVPRLPPVGSWHKPRRPAVEMVCLECGEMGQ